MSVFSSWVLGIAGVCVLGVGVDLISSSGPMHKFVKTVYAFFVILIVILPIPNLLKNDFNMNSIFSYENVYIQEDFIYQRNKDKIASLEKNIITSIEECGLNNVKIIISANIFTNNMKIDTVFVDLLNVVISKENKHINTNETIIKCVKQWLDIEEEDIVFNE